MRNGVTLPENPRTSAESNMERRGRSCNSVCLMLMPHFRANLAAVLGMAVVLVLAGCEGNPFADPEPAPEPVPVAPAPPPTPPPEPQLSAREYVTRAVDRLQEGDSEAARADLNRALALSPRNSMARELLAQLDVDPETAFSAESFEYTVVAGDSLSLIAQRFLGDPLQFYLLARYNDIERPARLAVGQTLRIPGRAPEQQEDRSTGAQTVDAEPKVSERPPATQAEPEAPKQPSDAQQAIVPAAASTNVDYPVAYRLFENGDYAGAISVLENSAADEVSRALLVSSYRAYAEQLSTQERLPEARSVLASAVALDPGDDNTIRALASLDDRIEASLLFDQGMVEMRDAEYEQAYESFGEALIYQPEFAQASEQRALAALKLVEVYLTQAEQHVAEQETDAALALWNKVLEIDPDNEQAAERKKELEGTQ